MINNFTLATVGKRAVFSLRSGTWKFLLLLTTCNVQCIVAGLHSGTNDYYIYFYLFTFMLFLNFSLYSIIIF